MPTTHNTSDEPSQPDYSKLDKEKPTDKPLPTNTQQSESRSTTRNYSHLDKEQSTNKPLPTNTQQSESRSTTATTGRPPRHDSQDVKPHTGGRDSRKASSDTLSDITTKSTATATPTLTSRQRTTSLSTDRHKPRSGNSNSQRGAASDGESSDPLELGAPRNQERSFPAGRSNLNRVPLKPQSTTYAQAAQQPPLTSKDLQQPQGATEDTSAKGSAHHSSTRKPQESQVPPGHHSEDGHQDRTVENKQPMSQVSGYANRGVMGAAVDTIMSYIPTVAPPPKDKYQQLKEEYFRIRDENKQYRAAVDNYDRELRRRTGELNKANHYAQHFQHELQRARDTIGGFQNELNNVHQQLEDAKALSEVRGKELVGAQVFLTKADTLSISEVGEKVTALNEEIFQAAATLGEALIHKRYDVSQKEFEAADALAQEMVGEKMTNVLIAQAQKQESEVNPLLVQVVLQIFMVKFCVSKIQSWYPGDASIGDFLSTIYYEIRSTEEQAVSGRWRALTRAHTRPSTESWNKELYKKLQSVLMVASWAPLAPENEESYGNRLPSIFKAINELRMAMGEKFTSADLDIYVFECDKIYDPTIMEDAYGDGRQSSGKRAPEAIVGTTGIGLGKYVSEGSEDEVRIQTLIPAKIVLTSTMNEALEPVQPKRRKTTRKPVETTDGADREGRASSRSKAASINMDVT